MGDRTPLTQELHFPFQFLYLYVIIVFIRLAESMLTLASQVMILRELVRSRAGSLIQISLHVDPQQLIIEIIAKELKGSKRKSSKQQWKVRLENVYRSDRQQRIQRAYEILLPEFKPTKKQKPVEVKRNDPVHRLVCQSI